MNKFLYSIIEIFFGMYAMTGLLSEEYSVFMFSMVIMIVVYIYNKKKNEEKLTTNENKESLITNKNDITVEYVLRSFLTNSEIKFYNIIKELNEEYIVVPQVNLGTIIDKINGKYRNELFKNIDFGIFDKNFKLLVLIELNDETHNTDIRRKDRDLRVKKILKDCNIKLLTFYTKYPNEKEYVINRIKNKIKETNEEPYSK